MDKKVKKIITVSIAYEIVKALYETAKAPVLVFEQNRDIPKKPDHVQSGNWLSAALFPIHTMKALNLATKKELSAYKALLQHAKKAGVDVRIMTNEKMFNWFDKDSAIAFEALIFERQLAAIKAGRVNGLKLRPHLCLKIVNLGAELFAIDPELEEFWSDAHLDVRPFLFAEEKDYDPIGHLDAELKNWHTLLEKLKPHEGTNAALVVIRRIQKEILPKLTALKNAVAAANK